MNKVQINHIFSSHSRCAQLTVIPECFSALLIHILLFLLPSQWTKMLCFDLQTSRSPTEALPLDLTWGTESRGIHRHRSRRLLVMSCVHRLCNLVHSISHKVTSQQWILHFLHQLFDSEWPCVSQGYGKSVTLRLDIPRPKETQQIPRTAVLVTTFQLSTEECGSNQHGYTSLVSSQTD